MSTEVIQEFRRCLMAMAQTAEVQINLFPDFAYTGDELVLDFDEALQIFYAAQEQTLTVAQKSAIEALNLRIEELSGKDLDFWLDKNALRSDPRWEELRLLAKQALASFDWKLETPDPSRAIYVGTKGKN